MADLLTSQEFRPTVTFTTDSGQPARVDGTPVWASSDATIASVTPSADGMSAVVRPVAPGGPVRISVSADADLGAGVKPINGVSPDFNVAQDPADQASVVAIDLGAPVPINTP